MDSAKGLVQTSDEGARDSLTSPALTHTPSGGEIAVAARAACPEPSRRSDQWVEVSVRDTGSGIAA
jgi:hypothetical protein